MLDKCSTTGTDLQPSNLHLENWMLYSGEEQTPHNLRIGGTFISLWEETELSPRAADL